MTRVKVCGLTRAEDVGTVVEAGADAVGAIVDVPVDSPRAVSADQARSLFETTPPFVTTVLVTMPETAAEARELVAAIEPDVLQVHGGLDEDAIEALTEAIEADVIVAVDANDPAAAKRYAAVADAIVVDSTDESGAGGTGRTHDWEGTRQIRDDLDVPVVLAGGLTPDVVGAGIETVDPYAVDVASGVEQSGGIKDPAAVDAFVRAARSEAR
jgi:phosphoribosylanthranilate isomerase